MTIPEQADELRQLALMLDSAADALESDRAGLARSYVHIAARDVQRAAERLHQEPSSSHLTVPR